MKRLNQFARLPQEDQTLILNLCDKLPYRAVVEQLAQPRSEGGLALTTCPSAVCKFYHRHHPEAVAAQALGQFASTLQVNHQAHGEANFQAILALVQNRILTALREGKTIADLEKDFRTLERVQKCFLSDEKFRHQNEHTQDAYLHDVAVTAQQEDEPDYIDTTIPDDPGAGPVTLEDFELDQTQFERDSEFAQQILTPPEASRYSNFERSTVRILRQRRAAERRSHLLRAYNVNPAHALAELQDPTPAKLLKLQQKLERATATTAAHAQRESPPEISSPYDPKSPAISTISRNFHSPVSSGNSPTESSSALQRGG